MRSVACQAGHCSFANRFVELINADSDQGDMISEVRFWGGFWHAIFEATNSETQSFGTLHWYFLRKGKVDHRRLCHSLGTCKTFLRIGSP